MADLPWQPPTLQFNETTKFDPFARSVSVITEAHRLIHEGLFYYAFRTEFDIPDGDFRYALFRTGNIPVHFKGLNIRASEGPVNLNFFENATINDPSPLNEIVVQNANRLSSNMAQMKIFALGDGAGIISSPIGLPFLGNLFVPANGNAGVEGETGIEELVLLPNTDYVLEVQNDPAGGGTADIQITIAFYELDWANASGSQ